MEDTTNKKIYRAISGLVRKGHEVVSRDVNGSAPVQVHGGCEIRAVNAKMKPEPNPKPVSWFRNRNR